MAQQSRSRQMAADDPEEIDRAELEARIRRYKQFVVGPDDVRSQQAIEDAIAELERQLERLNSRQV